MTAALAVKRLLNDKCDTRLAIPAPCKLPNAVCFSFMTVLKFFCGRELESVDCAGGSGKSGRNRMFGCVLLASAAIAAAPVPVDVSASRADWFDVGYDELRGGHAEAAIDRIRANRSISADDPSALINLGAAHARIGKSDEARAFYLAAIASKERYDVQLADGRWMDTRRAARLAIAMQQQGATIALR
jgi:hypothetical protein